MAVLTGKCASCGKSFQVQSVGVQSYGAGRGSAIGRSVCSRACELQVDLKGRLAARADQNRAAGW